jgi:hypothetical protein
LLSLEPGSEAGLVEDVIAGQLLGGRARHLFSTYDANVIRVGQLFVGGVRVPGVHVVDGPAREDDVVEGFLEGAHRQVHRPDGEQRQRVDADHDDDEQDVKDDLKTETYCSKIFFKLYKTSSLALIAIYLCYLLSSAPAPVLMIL